MIKTPLSTVIGGAFWTPGATVINGAKLSFEIVMKKLFANGEQGFWYDPNDLSTMYQDAGGTVPVTAAGQPVGLMKDKSGRNNHAFQTTSASRPILRQNAETGANYLEFDGSDDFLQTSNIDFTGTDKVSLFSGVRKFGTTRGTIAEFGAGGFGRFILNSNRLDATSFSYLGENASPFPSVQSMDSAVLSAQANLSAKTHSLKANNVKTSSLWLGNLSTTYQNAAAYIGRQAGGAYSFNGHIYCLIGVGKLTSDTETAAIEKELAKRVGVTLNV